MSSSCGKPSGPITVFLFERLRRAGLALVAALCFSAISAFAAQPALSASSPEGSSLASVGRRADDFLFPEKKNLVALTGQAEVPVLVDIDRQYVKSLAVGQIFEGQEAQAVAAAALPEAVNAGRGFSRENLAALARVDQAHSQTAQARAMLLPSVVVRMNYGEEKSKPSVVVDETSGELVASDTHTRTDAALTVSQPLFDLPSFLDLRRRRINEAASRDRQRASDADAAFSTIKAFLSLLESRLRMDISADYEERLAKLLEYIEKRAGAGAASISDMSRVRARSQETRSSILEQKAIHLSAGVDFVRLTNIVPNRVRVPRPDEVGASAIPLTFAGAVETALKSNPELLALAAEMRAAQMQRSVARGRFLPRVDLEYSDNYSLHAGGEPNSQGQRDRRLMMVMNWDLFNSGKDYSYVAEREARVRELKYSLDDQRRRVVQDLSANYATLATTRERLDSGYKELSAIATAARAMSKRMLSGNQSLLDLLDVYNRYFEARTRLVKLHILEMRTLARIVRLTTGTPPGA